jgi:serine/threonine protein kinase
MRSDSNDYHLALPIGTRLSEFRIDRILGSGGFGITYAAYDTDLMRKVAIKEFFPVVLATRLSSYEVSTQDEEGAREFGRQLKRFLNEATILAQLDHPNLVRVSRYMRANGTAYFVMEYIEGATLEQHFGSSPGLPAEADIRSVLDQILAGLACLHGRNLLHRDLKPDNILMTGRRAVIIDLGVAKSATPYSMTGEAFCTPGYTPFEQYQTHGDMGPWTDLYALGATMHKLLTGQAPPEALKRLDQDPYQPLARRLAGQYSRPLLQAIDRALAVNVRDRPQSVAALRKLLGGAGQATLSPGWRTLWPFRGFTLPGRDSLPKLGGLLKQVRMPKIGRFPKLNALPRLDWLPFDPRFMIAGIFLFLLALLIGFLIFT